MATSLSVTLLQDCLPGLEIAGTAHHAVRREFSHFAQDSMDHIHYNFKGFLVVVV